MDENVIQIKSVARIKINLDMSAKSIIYMTKITFGILLRAVAEMEII